VNILEDFNLNQFFRRLGQSQHGREAKERGTQPNTFYNRASLVEFMTFPIICLVE